MIGHPGTPRARTLRAPLASLLAASLALFGACDRAGHEGASPEPASEVLAPSGDVEPLALATDVPATIADMETLDRLLFFPLAQGNRWTYAHRYSFRMIPIDGDPEVVESFENTVECVINGTEELFGRTYTVMRFHDDYDDNFPFSWIRARQDPSGLYEADVSITDPPGAGGPAQPPVTLAANRSSAASRLDPRTAALVARVRASWQQRGVAPQFAAALEQLALRHGMALAALRGPGAGMNLAAGTNGGPRRGGPLEHELARLRYPLCPGAHWQLTPEFPYTLTVERPVLVTVPAGRFLAWRLRAGGAWFGPRDRVLFWYSRCGQLKLDVHVESEVTDEQGNVLGTVVMDERLDLTDLDLTRRLCN